MWSWQWLDFIIVLMTLNLMSGVTSKFECVWKKENSSEWGNKWVNDPFNWMIERFPYTGRNS